ncbi:hypothetical protein [Leptospira soteropolitanensis]|nr:hypothetical protein [Leptospira soteropolitanensis]
MAVLTVAILPLLFLDTRTLLGANVWIKPLKFSLSLGLYSMTTVWVMVKFLKDWKFNRRIQIALTITALIEIVLITFQASRAELSHFNVTNIWNQIVYSVMGTSISIFWAFHLWMGYSIFRKESITKSVKESLVWGMFIAGFGMIIGFFMTTPRPDQLEAMKQGIFATSGSHQFGSGDPGEGILFFGWSTKLGDMRVPHFFGMHVMQLFVFLAAYLINKKDSILNQTMVRIMGVLFLTINIFMVIQTLNGESIFHFNAFYSSVYGIFFLLIAVCFCKLILKSNVIRNEVTV